MPALTDAQRKAMAAALRGPHPPMGTLTGIDARLVGGAVARPAAPKKPRGFIIGTRG